MGMIAGRDGEAHETWDDTSGPGKGNTTTDPTTGDVDSDAIHWPHQGHDGLSLTIVNAMDEAWHSDLEVAVQNWQGGSSSGVGPALTVSMETASPDETCQPIRGKMKVCNGNYGSTGWKGVNEMAINSRTKEIKSSAARMNEYYLREGGQPAQRLYTLCHELGHGFGLPHWDEDFYNEDLGHCMDYASNVEYNQRPDASNFVYLEELYGTSTAKMAASLSFQSMPAGKYQGNEDSEANVEESSFGNRKRRYLLRPPTPSHSKNDAPSAGIAAIRPPSDTFYNGQLTDNGRILMHYLELSEESFNDTIIVHEYLLA